MNESTGRDQERFVSKSLLEAQRLAESNNFAGALAAVQEAKKAKPTNVYILAFEKQVEQLITLAKTHNLSDEARTDILESIPGIIERAQKGPSAPVPPSARSAAQKPAEGHADKVAALEWLKNQYFQHAHDYVKKGEYQHALAEIRRVFIIEPDNHTARDFEKQIEELAALKSAEIPELTTKALTEQNSPQPHPVRKHAPASEPSVAASSRKPPELATTEHPAPRRRLANALVAVILVAIAFIGYEIFIIVTKPKPPRLSLPSKSGAIAPPQDAFYGDPATATERTFEISMTDSTGKSPADSASLEENVDTGSTARKKQSASPTPRSQGRSSAAPAQSPRKESGPRKEDDPSQSSRLLPPTPLLLASNSPPAGTGESPLTRA